MSETPPYQTPALDRIGDFESLTQGGTQGTRFDGTFTQGDLVPLDPQGNPLIFS